MSEIGIFHPKYRGFKHFIWDSERSAIFGRTATSWFKITFFYTIYYSCLAGFFAIMMAVFYSTVDAKAPTYTPGPEGGSLLRNTALGFRPRPRHAGSSLIWYDSNNIQELDHFTRELEEFIRPYQSRSNDDQRTRKCTFDKYEEEKEAEAVGIPRDRRPCRFQDTELSGSCAVDKKWGFRVRSPCILLKMNKMINFEPDVYKTLDELPNDMPTYLKDQIVNMTYASNSSVLPPIVWVSCEGTLPADREQAPNIDLSPYPGFPAYYFPYENVPGYLSPLVGVTFTNPAPHVVISIDCRLWAKNIEFSRADRLGLVQFELLID